MVLSLEDALGGKGCLKDRNRKEVVSDAQK